MRGDAKHLLLDNGKFRNFSHLLLTGEGVNSRASL